MHVENRVNRATMLANDYAIDNELYEGSTDTEQATTLERLTIQFLLAELINTELGLSWKGEKLE